MKFPSIKSLTENAGATIKRFPFEVLFALAGTIAATTLIELSEVNRVAENWCIRTMMMANLGLLLSLSVTLYAESKGILGRKKMLLRLVTALVSVSLIFLLNPAEHQSDHIRFFLFSLSFHLLVAFAGFTAPGQIQGFWQFNKTLFLRFLTSALYGAVLFLGLAAAIGAMNFLFNFKFEWDTFVILFTWIVGMFSTLFFLSGVPKDLQALDTDFSYPKGLKVFTQYVLIPLATIYVLILLAYEAKILLQWQLPKGLVSNLILGYAVFGFLSLLLVYPVREQEENKWLKTYTRSFYFLLIPLLALLFTAAGTRVFRYGITEMRYFLILLAVWLLFITVYFLITKKQNIKLIPISLSLLTLLSIYGPQSAFSVSMYSQRRVLVEVFKKNKAFKEGKLIAVDSLKIGAKDGSKAVATLDYLITKHDLQSLQPYFSQDLQRISDSLSAKVEKNNSNRFLSVYELRSGKLDWAKKHLGLTRFYGYYDRYRDTITAVDTGPVEYTLHTAEESAAVIKGYEYVLDEAGVSDTADYKLDGLTAKRFRSRTGQYTLKLNNSILTFDLRPALNNFTQPKALKSYKKDVQGAINLYTVPAANMMFTQQNDQFVVTMVVERISFEKNEKKQW